MYVFAQLRQLPALAPYIPTKEPRLRQTAYEMVLHSFLLAPADHPRLLDALLKWPPDLYSIPSLTQSVINRSGPPPPAPLNPWTVWTIAPKPLPSLPHTPGLFETITPELREPWNCMYAEFERKHR